MESDKVELVCEMDEQWSFVGHKKQPRWLWYVWQPHLKTVLAYELGTRRDDTLKRLLGLLQAFNIRLYCTDGWEAYNGYCHPTNTSSLNTTPSRLSDKILISVHGLNALLAKLCAFLSPL